MKVSVLLLTRNEEANLPRCLDALHWCDDIVVLDSGSTDGTVSLAQSRGARVLNRPFDDFATQRNYGLDFGNLANEWVLHLDADEVVTPAFKAALESCEPPSDIDAYHVPSKLILFGTWLRYSGMYPVYQVRIGRRDVLRFKQVGHGQREDLTADRIDVFAEPYLHYSFSQGLAVWFVRHVRYAHDEASLLADTHRAREGGWSMFFSSDPVKRRRALKSAASAIPLPLRPLFRFFHVYFLRRGYRDGQSGLTYALMLAVYEAMAAVLAQEIRRNTNIQSETSDSSVSYIP
jgi:glycosyltransferase involved in cell wall biosynthesis